MSLFCEIRSFACLKEYGCYTFGATEIHKVLVHWYRAEKPLTVTDLLYANGRFTEKT